MKAILLFAICIPSVIAAPKSAVVHTKTNDQMHVKEMDLATEMAPEDAQLATENAQPPLMRRDGKVQVKAHGKKSPFEEGLIPSRASDRLTRMHAPSQTNSLLETDAGFQEDRAGAGLASQRTLNNLQREGESEEISTATSDATFDAEASADAGDGYICVHVCNRDVEPEKFHETEHDRVEGERADGTCTPFEDGQYTMPANVYDPNCGDGARCVGPDDNFGPYGCCVCTEEDHDCISRRRRHAPSLGYHSLLEDSGSQEQKSEDPMAEELNKEKSQATWVSFAALPIILALTL